MKPFKSLLYAGFVLASIFIASFFLDLGELPWYNPFSKSEQKKALGILQFQQYQREKARQDSLIWSIQKKYQFTSTSLQNHALEELYYQPLEYDRTLETHPLHYFYKELQHINTHEGCVRVLHYGDSQLENDRITQSFRTYIQQDFGGYAKGQLPLLTNYTDGSPYLKKSAQWGMMQVRKTRYQGNYGICNAYLHPPLETQIQVKGKNTQGHIEIAVDKLYPKMQEPLVLTLLTHEALTPDNLHIQTLPAQTPPLLRQQVAYGVQRLDFSIDSPISSIQLKIDFLKNRNIYALSLQSPNGVCVDNLAFRGNLGNVFSSNNRRFLTDQLHLMDVKLIIYQFGTNAIPQNPEEVREDFYENFLLKELNYLKQLYPEVGVIVVGVPDRSIKSGMDYQTHPYTLRLNEIQKRVALKTGCAYWNLFEAMGGVNSMYRWVNSEPALANKDYIHFSNSGCQKVGGMLYKALIYDYIQFITDEKDKEIQKIKIL